MGTSTSPHMAWASASINDRPGQLWPHNGRSWESARESQARRLRDARPARSASKALGRAKKNIAAFCGDPGNVTIAARVRRRPERRPSRWRAWLRAVCSRKPSAQALASTLRLNPSRPITAGLLGGADRNDLSQEKLAPA